MTYRVGIDIGGTFTDVVFLSADGQVLTAKVPSTPDDYALGIETALEALLAQAGAGGGELTELIHGTTVATNTILEHKGACTGLLTTEGFRDVLEIRRLRMPVLYDLRWRKPPPLVPRALRLEVRERIDHRGMVHRPLDEAQARKSIAALLDAGVDAVAVCLLNAYANGTHEARLRELVRERDAAIPVCLSSEVLPEIKEYERTSTTVVNAYIAPVVERYVHSLQGVLARLAIDAPLLVMQSNGGAMGAAAAAAKPIHIIESGPAAGVVGAAEVARRLGITDALTFDMGGTTAKASLIEGGRFDRVGELDVGAGLTAGGRLLTGGGYLVRVPAIDIAEVGAGGGSLVTIDPGGALSVGPESAGADPGPAAYGRGNRAPTVTDANLVLGYLNPDYLVGGALAVHADLARSAIETALAEPLAVPVETAAFGVHTIANAAMARALRAVSSERGRDPRRFTLLAFGGNGGVHGASLAASMEIARVVIPPVAGVFSALGLLFPHLQHHYVQTYKAPVDAIERADLERVFRELERAGETELAGEGYADRIGIERLADLRYAGENSELTVPVGGGDLAPVVRSFHAAHQQTYGYHSEDEVVEVVNLRVIATGLDTADRVPERVRLRSVHRIPGGTRRAYFGPGHGWVEAPVVGRAAVGADAIEGPLLIEDYDATTVVPPGAAVARGDWDVLVITVPSP